MSTAATSNTSTNGSPVSAVDLVRTLTDEEKGHVLIALLRELIEINGGGKGLIPIDTPEGESLGYYVPPLAAKARFEAYGPKFTPEEWAELKRQKLDTSDTITAEEWIAQLKARAAELEKQTP
jgi:hypothetical protein